MTKLSFIGDISTLADGIYILKDDLKFTICDDGFPVHLNRHSQNTLTVSRKGNEASISFRDNIHFFRALGILLQNLPGGQDFTITEPVIFDTNGVMFDVSQGNSVMNVQHVKFFMRRMAVMGLNMLMLYTEDSYDVDKWEYFGYMRGRYTQKELKELDDYAFALGIELIPCIQTLAHLAEALKWPCFSDMRDDEDTLLVGYEKVYQFIEDMIVSASRPLRTKRIHIGMDEAWRLGQGMYLLKNGYTPKAKIMLQHLNRVMEITNRLGLKPMLWSDMFFRACSKTEDYYDSNLVITQEIINNYPKNAQLVYWDYYHDDVSFYEDFIQRHKQFGTVPIFAGGIWTWTSFSPNWAKTFSTTNAALTACKKENVREVFATVWGDDCTECNIDTNLLGMQLFAEHGYSYQLDMNKLEERLYFTTGIRLNEILQLNYMDEVPGTEKGNKKNFNATKILMWQDILCGLFDKDIEGLELNKHYERLGKKFEEYSRNPSDFSEAYLFYSKVASVLAIKAELGLRIKAAYDRQDRAELLHYAEKVLPELLARITDLKNYHRMIWMKTNKTLGWETFDLRYGTVMNRIDTAIFRLKEFCAGKISNIEELDEPRRYYFGEPNLKERNSFASIASASRFSFYILPPVNPA